MAKFPYLPLFTDAYLGDTTHLNTTEHGAYLLLLMAQWRSRDCLLPNDDKLLARYVKMNPREWAEVRPILEPFFQITTSLWSQKRLADERNYVEGKRKKNIAAGKVSALKRKERHSTDVPTNVQQTYQRTYNEPTTHTHKEERKKDTAPSESNLVTDSLGAQREKIACAEDATEKPKKSRGTRLPPDWVLPDEWGEWALAYCAKHDLHDALPFVKEQHAVFKNYWIAKTSAATKLDWKATWENWIRRALPQHLLNIKRMEREKSYEQIRRGR